MAADHLDGAVLRIDVDAAAVIPCAVIADAAVLQVEKAAGAVHLDAAAVAVRRAGAVGIVARHGDIVEIDLSALSHIDSAAAGAAVAAVDDAAVQRLISSRVAEPVGVGDINRLRVRFRRLVLAVVLRSAVDDQRRVLSDVEHAAVAPALRDIAREEIAAQLHGHGFALRQDIAVLPRMVQIALVQADGGVIAGDRGLPRRSKAGVVCDAAVRLFHIGDILRRKRR